MAGTVESGSRDANFSLQGYSDQLLQHWGDLEGGTEYIQTTASFDAAIALEAVESAAQAAYQKLVDNNVLAEVLVTGYASPALAIVGIVSIAAEGEITYLEPQ